MKRYSFLIVPGLLILILAACVALPAQPAICPIPSTPVLIQPVVEPIPPTMQPVVEPISPTQQPTATPTQQPETPRSLPMSFGTGSLDIYGPATFRGAVTDRSNLAIWGNLTLTATNAAGGSANPIDYTATAGIMNGSDDLTVIDINLTNADHTSTGNTVQALDIAAITGDANATETAINVGTGWDSGLTNASPSTFSGAVTESSTVAQTLVNGAGASANPWDFAGTLGIMDGSDDFTLFDVNITNADHTSTGNTVQVLDIAAITGDAHATETAIKVGDGWDFAANLGNGGLTTTGQAIIGSGYGSTGCTIAAAGTIQCDDWIATGSYLTANGIVSTNSVQVMGDDTDIILFPDTTGGNMGKKSEFVGLPRIRLVSLGTGTNGTSETVSYIDTNPTGEWTEVDAGTNVLVTADTDFYRVTTNSVKIAFTDVITGDGVSGAIVEDDLSANESLGFWIYSTVALTSGDFTVTLDDTDGTDQSYNVPAVVANIWTWVELDISGCDANCNTTTSIKFLATAQGGTAHAAANVYLDGMYKWDATDEEALGVAIQTDGVLSVVAVATDETAANTTSDLAEQTAYFVNYESTVDFIVWITDQSANSNSALVAY